MMQAPRASRISEAEWSSRRQKLERLYLDDDLSRQEVRERMAREDNFHATEKQLKYQFSKWGLKKNVSDQDLTLMLSFKRKRQELGKHTGFEYRGHLFEQERLERASKRRKGPLVSSPILPPYITALVSPRRSPHISCSLPPHPQVFAFSHGIEEATHNGERQSSLEFFFNNSFHQSRESTLSDTFGQLDIVSDSTFFRDGEQAQVNHGSEEILFYDGVVSLSPRHRSLVQTPSGQDVPATRTEESSPPVQQITSILSDTSAAQGVDSDIDFSMWLNSSRRPSTAQSSSHAGSHHRRSVKRISIASLLQPRDHGGSQENNRELSHISTIASAADQPPDSVTGEESEEFSQISEVASVADQRFGRVTGEDSGAESIATLLLLVKSHIFPRFDTTVGKYTYEGSDLSELFCPHQVEWFCFEIEDLLSLYLERSLRTIRKRRTAGNRNSFSSRSNLYLNEHNEGPELLGSTRRLFNPTEITRTRSVFSRRFPKPIGEVVFDIRQGSSSPISEDRLGSYDLITMSFIPRAAQRTPGLCVRLFRTMDRPAIPPQINTFNVIPDDSAIIHCIRTNDLRGIQTLFDRGEASARDVNSGGLSLLQYTMYTECFDIFRFLVQGGASLYQCGYDVPALTDFITAVWDQYAQAHSGCISSFGFSMEKVKEFEHCVAFTRLALDNDCILLGRDQWARATGPDFKLVGTLLTAADASTWVKPIGYLSSIGWDFEKKNDRGQTPLLYSATNCGPWFKERLRVLIGHGARLDVKDNIGRGPLFSVLSGPIDESNWADLIDPEHSSYCSGGDCDNNWALRESFNTECHKYVRDSYDTEGIVDPHTNPTSPKTSKSTSSLNKSNNSQLETDHGSNVAAEAITPTSMFISNSDSDESSCAEVSVRNSEDEHYVWAVDCDGAAHWIRDPIHVLKDRARMALEVLLEAGCDPNELGPDGQSPSDYARRGLWPQWRWALEATGYIFDEEQNRCIKRTDEQ